jgi:hypothetical protein
LIDCLWRLVPRRTCWARGSRRQLVSSNSHKPSGNHSEPTGALSWFDLVDLEHQCWPNPGMFFIPEPPTFFPLGCGSEQLSSRIQHKKRDEK